MTLKELAEYLDVPVARLSSYLTARGKKRIAARKVRGRWQISRESVQDWLVAAYEEQIKRTKPALPQATNGPKAAVAAPPATAKSARKRAAAIRP